MMMRFPGMAGVIGLALAFVPSLAFAEDQDDAKVSITLSAHGFQTKLLIPQEYISQNLVKGHQNGPVILEATFPDFKPLPPEARQINPEFNRNSLEKIMQSGEYTSIWISQGLKSGMENIITDLEKSNVLLEKDSNFPEFKVYTYHKPDNQAENIHFQPRYLVPEDKRYQDKLYIDLVKQDLQLSQQRLYFTEHLEYNNLLYGHFSASYTKLAQWKELDTQVNNFVNSLISSDQKQEPKL